jgi:hypothetical protein
MNEREREREWERRIRNRSERVIQRTNKYYDLEGEDRSFVYGFGLENQTQNVVTKKTQKQNLSYLQQNFLSLLGHYVYNLDVWLSYRLLLHLYTQKHHLHATWGLSNGPTRALSGEFSRRDCSSLLISLVATDVVQRV